MQDREVSCMYYECEGQCLKGKEGTFRGSCQKCKLYLPLKAASQLEKTCIGKRGMIFVKESPAERFKIIKKEIII